MSHWVNVGAGCVFDPYSEDILKRFGRYAHDLAVQKRSSLQHVLQQDHTVGAGCVFNPYSEDILTGSEWLCVSSIR